MHVVFESYVRSAERKRRKEGTIRNIRFSLKKLDDFCAREGIDPLAIRPEEAEEWFDGLLSTQAWTTCELDLVNVRACYRYAINALELLEKNPTRSIILPKRPDVQPETLTNDELRAMFDACETEEQDFTLTLYAYTGLRNDEGRSLKWTDIDFARNEMTVLGKGDKLRQVPIHSHLRERLIARQRKSAYVLTTNRRQKVSLEQFYRRVKPLFAAIGRDPKQPCHIFRKTFATALFEAEVQSEVIDQICGWAPRTVRQRHYTRIADKRMQTAIEKLYADAPITPRVGRLPVATAGTDLAVTR